MDEEGFARGNADELFRFRDQLADFDPDVVLVMSADHVYRLDFDDVLDTHREQDAECTVVVVESPEGDDPGDHGVVEIDDDGRVTGFAYKPDEPDVEHDRGRGDRLRPDVLREVLEELHRELGAGQRRGRHRAGRLRRPPAARAWSTAAAPSRTGTTATGATSASRTTTCAPTTRCSPTTATCCRCRAGRSCPGCRSGCRPGARRAVRLSTACSRPARGSSGVVRRSVLGPGRRRRGGRRGPRQRGLRRHRGPRRRPVHWSVVDADCVVESDARLGYAGRRRPRRPGRRHPGRPRAAG